MWSRTAFTLGLLTAALPAVAAAASDDLPSREASKIRFMGNLGIGSAVGELGGTFTYAPRPEIQLELGAGLGISGLQLSVMPKLTAGTQHHRLTFGVGPSVGIGNNEKPAETCVSLWLNGEVGYEYRSSSGLSFLVAVGVFKGIAGHMPGGFTPGISHEGESIPPEAVADGPLSPQGRIAVGRWF
jgi:hypothetical protein